MSANIKKQKSYNVGDYVYNTNHHIIRITSDDMPELPYEKILGLVPDSESPHFEFTALPGWFGMRNENFFNACKSRCPLAYKIFSNWMINYKVKFKWAEIFNVDLDFLFTDKKAPSPEFEDLPWDMQIGIMIHFFNGVLLLPRGNYNWLSGTWEFPKDLIDHFVHQFITLEIQIRNQRK